MARNQSRNPSGNRGDDRRSSEEGVSSGREGEEGRYDRAVGQARGEEPPGREDYGRSFNRGGSENFGHTDKARYGNDDLHPENRRSQAVNYGQSGWRSAESRGQAHGDYDFDRNYYGAPNRMGREDNQYRNRRAPDDIGERFGGDRGGRTYSDQSFARGDRFEGEYGDGDRGRNGGRGRQDGGLGRGVGGGQGSGAYWSQDRGGENWSQDWNQRGDRTGRGDRRGYAQGNSWNDDRSGNNQNEDRRRGQFDSQYMRWREEQIRKMDSDYEEYLKENHNRFHEDFHSWRSRRDQGDQGGQEQSRSGQSATQAGVSETSGQAGKDETGTAANATARAKTVGRSRKSATAKSGSSKAGNTTGKSVSGPSAASGPETPQNGQTDPSSLQRRQ